MSRSTPPEEDGIQCEQCLEWFAPALIALTDDDIPLCRKCWRELRRSDGWKEQSR